VIFFDEESLLHLKKNKFTIEFIKQTVPEKLNMEKEESHEK